MSTFERTWQSWPGWRGWLCEVNNQRLGVRFMVTSGVFFVVGGVMALLMRLQLAVPDNDLIGPDLFNQLFTMHGSTMMYLFAVPFLEGLALYLLPLLLGCRDVAFPRLTAFSYWVYLFGGLVFYASFLTGTVPDAGWFSYTPLSGPRYSGLGVDFWLLGLSLVEVAGLTAGAEIVVTILKFRAPGMALNRMPMFAWAMLVTGVMILFAFTTLLMATLLLELDRSVGTKFFDPNAGGNSLLWQHLFWFFGHPEVYIMFIPATGIISMVVAAVARRALAGYVLVAVAIVLTGFVSFGLWVHHMFTTGLPELAMGFFTAASLMIGVASGVQVFAWIGTLWGTRPRYRAHFLFVLGFLFLFVLGGMTGVMVAVVPFDTQVHDTYFIVAHFHYVLIGGVIFPVMAGLHFWAPKIMGRMMSQRLGVASFWLTFVGFNVAFFPMHWMGLVGMPRRIYTYRESLGVGGENMMATVGAFVLGFGFVVVLWNLVWSIRRGPRAEADPWGGESLEWSIPSPPPVFSFARLPVVRSRHPMWSQEEDQLPTSEALQRTVDSLDGRPETWRATLVTDALTAVPQGIQALPGPTPWPLLTASAVVMAALGVLAGVYLLAPVAMVAAVGALMMWLCPRRSELKVRRKSPVGDAAGLPVFTTGSKAVGWWGMVCLLGTIGTAFGALFYSHFYLWLFSEEWPQNGIAKPGWWGGGMMVLAWVASGGAMHAGVLAFHSVRRWLAMGCWGAAMAAGAAGLVTLCVVLMRVDFDAATNAYGSIFYVIHWLLALVFATALVLMGTAYAWVWREEDWGDGFNVLLVQVAAMFWYFAVGATVAVGLVVYVSPWVL